ncbi:MAG: phosphotransferase [Candidatus Hermodarchaeota archaeon]
MPSTALPWTIISSLKALLGEDYSVTAFERLPSRRNEVYKITGTQPTKSTPNIVIAKLYHQPGIAHETSVLKTAKEHQIPVPHIIGTTSDVLVLEYISGPNLCDLITENPKPKYGQLLAFWLAKYHDAFRRNGTHTLVKGDTRIRNFLYHHNHLVGVDFEESHIGPYFEDLAVACASILDTDPLFTNEKLQLCRVVVESYAPIHQIEDIPQLKSIVTKFMIKVLWQTAERRRNPPDLIERISLLEKGEIDI